MRRIGAVLVAALLLAGCAGAIGLSRPPNLYADGRNYPDTLVPEALQVVDPPVFYVTDRAPVIRDGVVAGYGTRRSDAMAFGAARVRFGASDWRDLVARTHVDRGGALSRLDVVGVREYVRFPEVPLPQQREGDRLEVRPEAARAYAAQAGAFRDALRAEVRRTGNGRVLVFVHGAYNDFDNALQTLASLWHFTGRRSVPVAFTWPAGNRGVLGYFRDQESGDFSVYHAKEFLTMLAEIPEVEEIDIVAHSRGSNVMSQALREMVIFNHGRGLPPRAAMKTGMLILAAPDLDVGTVRQRLGTERVAEAFEQINVYINPDDIALRLSSLLTRHPRIGAVGAKDFKPGELAALRREALVHFIQVEGAAGSESHSYFRNNPAVLSDIVLALRTRAFPGDPLRPLEEDADKIWRLQPNYPLERLPELELSAER